MQTLLSMFRTTNHVLTLSLADLTDDVGRRRARGTDGPSIAWTVGHLLHHRHNVLALLGEPQLNPWTERFGDTAATDGAEYPTLAELRAAWDTLHESLETTCATAEPGALDQPVPGSGPHGESKVRDKVAFLAWHEGYHVGVIGAARKAAGLPGPAEVVRAAGKKG